MFDFLDRIPNQYGETDEDLNAGPIPPHCSLDCSRRNSGRRAGCCVPSTRVRVVAIAQLVAVTICAFGLVAATVVHLEKNSEPPTRPYRD